MKKLPIGISDYKKVISEDYYFVDKTLLIQEIISASSAVTLICRPRRFGKTLNLSMLKYFFEKTEISNAHLFAGKKIWQNEDARSEQGKYPVIFISFKDVKGDNWESAYESITILIRKEFERQAQYLLPKLSEDQASSYSKIKSGSASSALYSESLLFLSELLFAHYGQEVVVLLDEYDSPIHAAYKYNYYDKMVNFIKTLFSKVLKDNIYLKSGVLTGILRTAKEGIFSGLNNLVVCSLLSREYSDKFGFTQEEVETLINEQQVPVSMHDIKYWYNGYRAGISALIYNPWSIINCARSHGELMPYWANTSDNALIKSLIINANYYVKQELEEIINNIPVTKTIEEAFTFATVYEMDNALWSLLLFSGYLTYSQRNINSSGKYECILTIPNHEIRELYKNLITEIFNQSLKHPENISKLFEALLTEETSAVQKFLQLFITNSMSFYDLAHNEPEKSYHLFILGLLVTFENTYSIRSNRESGYGRYDIMLIPHDKSKIGIVIEFKRVGDQTLEEAAETALLQIQDKKYANELYAQGITNVIGYGIAFAGKQVLVKSLVL